MPEPRPPQKRGGGIVRISEVRRVAALASLTANRGNQSETARATGISRRQLGRISQEQHDERLLRAAKRELASTCAVIALKCGKLLATNEVLASIAAGPHPDRLAIVMGVSVDKLDALTTTAIAGEGEALLELLADLRKLRTQTKTG